MSDYWRSVLSGRISRRRAVVVTGAGAAAAAFLAACGGGSSTEKGPVKDPQGLLAKIEDTSKTAKPGGVWPSALAADLPTLDPNQTTSGSALAPYGYSRLFLYRPAPFPELPKGEVDPDVAESSEQSPDGLTVTVKLRGDVKLDPRAPTSGRLLNANDVKWSWDKFASNNSSRGEMVNALSPSAPVVSVSVLDNRTVQFKLAHPVANFLSSLAFQRYMWVLPAEADGRFDPKIEMRGTGPWRLTKWEPSVGFSFDRNPDWHFKTGATPLNGIYHPIVSEYSQRRAQFLSGNLWSHSIDSIPVVRPEEIVQTKQENPKLSMYPKTFPVTRRALFTFGFLPNSPFHDVRIRRASSMVLDRDAWIDAFFNVSQYEKDGLPVDARWDSHYMAGEPPYWIDPKGKGLGEGAAYFQHNVAEATKLIRAAGITGALKTPGFFNAGASQNQQVQALQGMLNDSKLFDVSLEGFPTPEWNLKFHLGEGQHEGIAFNQSTGQSGDIDNHISVRYNEGNGQRIFFKKSPSQKMQDLVIAQRKELDEKKRLTILEDLQKEMAVVMPAVPWPGAATGFDLAWPYLENFAAFTARSNQTPMVETWSRFWYNESKKG